MNYAEEDFAKLYTLAVNSPGGKAWAPRAVRSHDGHIFHFTANGKIAAVHNFSKSEKEQAKNLPDYIFDSHVAMADICMAMEASTRPRPGYKEAIDAMRNLGIPSKAAKRMLSDHGIHPPKVAINLWSLHKFTSLEDWVIVNLEKRSDIK